MLNKAIKYRDATSKDISQIISLLQTVQGDDRDINADQFIIAYNNDMVIGCVRTKPLMKNCRELASLAILPQYRSQGIGEILVRKILQKDRYRPLYLICYSSMVPFYTKNNFKAAETGKLPDDLKRDFLNISEKRKDILVMVLQ